MVKLEKLVNMIYTKMIYVVCITHIFHQVTKQIKNITQKLIKLYLQKKVFCKTADCINVLKEKPFSYHFLHKQSLQNEKLVKESMFYSKNYELIQNITYIDKKYSVCINNSKKYLSDVSQNLIYIYIYNQAYYIDLSQHREQINCN